MARQERKIENAPAPKDEQTSIHDDSTVVSESEIADRAHALFEERGRTHGHDVDDWLQAERELQALNSNRLSKTA